MKNLVRGRTRNREVQGWDTKIIHFFKLDFYIIYRKYFIKKLLKKIINGGSYMREIVTWIYYI